MVGMIGILSMALQACNVQGERSRNFGAESSRTPQTNATSFGGISLVLPRQFAMVDESREELSSPIPDAKPTVEYFRSYRDPNGQSLYLFYWEGTPSRDRGPMESEQEWDIMVDTVPAKLCLTRVFFGRQQKVLVTHFQDPFRNGNPCLIYFASGDPEIAPARKAFMDILENVRFQNR
jgi:hypothetical protein